MISIDKVLESLKHSQWRNFEEMEKETSMNEDTLNKILYFLQEQEYISRENEKFRITSKGLKFLELPV